MFVSLFWVKYAVDYKKMHPDPSSRAGGHAFSVGKNTGSTTGKYLNWGSHLRTTDPSSTSCFISSLCGIIFYILDNKNYERDTAESLLWEANSFFNVFLGFRMHARVVKRSIL